MKLFPNFTRHHLIKHTRTCIFALSQGLIFPRGPTVSCHVVHAKCVPRLRHRSELTEEDWENAVSGQDNMYMTWSVQAFYGSHRKGHYHQHDVIR